MDRHTTTTLSPGRPAFWMLIVLVIVLVVLLLLATEVLAVDPPASGDWDVTEDTVISGTDIVVTGDVIVRNGASLTLSQLALSLNLSSHGQYSIMVETGGELYLTGVTVDSLDRATFFNFTIYGTAIIGGCTVRRMDGPQLPSPLSDPQGLVIESSDVRMHNTTVTGCNGFAVTVVPGGIVDVDPVIEDCTFLDNGGGIYCGGVLIAKGNAQIRSCSFSGSELGDVVAFASDPLVIDCDFTNSLLSYGISGVTAIGLAAPTITGCEFSFLLAAVNSLYADPTIKDCTISFCLAGVTVIGDDPLLASLTVSNCVVPINLTSTFATLNDCTVSGFTTIDNAVVIDGGKPIINGLTVDLTIIGGAMLIFNESRAVVKGSVLTGSGSAPVARVYDSMPTFEKCTLQGGTDGLVLVSSPAIVDGCLFRVNTDWGISSLFKPFANRGNTFGTGGDVNGAGRIIQSYGLDLWVELVSGQPAVDATVNLTNVLDQLVFEVATDAQGLALRDVYPEFEITNANRTITYAPYEAEAMLGDLFNITSFDISDNPVITLVLRPRVDLPPVVMIVSPKDGVDIDVWQTGNRVAFEGIVTDPEGGAVTLAWFVNDEMVNEEDLEFLLELAPGQVYQVSLMGADEGGQETRVYRNVSVISVPPEDNRVAILGPTEGEEFDAGEAVTLVCEYYVQDHPEQEAPTDLPVRWSSDIDGFLIEGVEGEVTNLTPGDHIITVTVVPRYPLFIPDPYTAHVMVTVLAPEPIGHANISSPADGAEFTWDAVVPLAANGSFIDIYDPPEYRAIYRWSSDIDGLLGEGDQLSAPHLTPGNHVITLLLTTDPFMVSAGATVGITVLPVPNTPPVARITILTAEPKAGEPVLMTASLSADPDGDILSHGWDLGDGNTTSLIEVNHTYAEAGNYTIRLTVFDGELETMDQVVIHVAPADDGGGNGNGGSGNGGGDGGDGDDGSISTSDSWLGWLFIVLLFAALGGLLVIWYGGKTREK